MFSLKPVFFGERSVTKVAALYNSRVQAEAAMRDLLTGGRFSPAQVKLLSPSSAMPARHEEFDAAVEPDDGGVRLTLLRAHAATALLGLTGGAGLCCGLLVSGNPGLRSSPVIGLVICAALGTMFGLLVGGLVSLRPDHSWLFASIRRALQSGKWAVVAHPRDAAETHQAMDALDTGIAKVMRSL